MVHSCTSVLLLLLVCLCSAPTVTGRRGRGTGTTSAPNRQKAEAAVAAALAALEPTLETSCAAIDRFDNITVSTFLTEYFQRKPFILVAGTDNTRARKKWTARYLKKRYGDADVKVGSPYELGVKHKKRTGIRLRDYLHRIGTGDIYSSAGHAPYIWTGGSEMLHDSDRRIWDAWPGFHAPGKMMQLAIGGPNTGIPFHFHKDGYSELIYGRKLWSLYPPGSVAPGHNMHDTHAEWFADIFPQLSAADRPASCILGPGQIIYVPEGWNHAVLNLEDSLAVATQISLDSNKFFESKDGTDGSIVARPRTLDDQTWFQSFLKASTHRSNAAKPGAPPAEVAAELQASLTEVNRAMQLNPTHSFPPFFLYELSEKLPPGSLDVDRNRLLQRALASHCTVKALRDSCVKYILDGNLVLFV
eukprot:SAG22_NODE_81_length_21778_cov_38.345173_12_plen_416_part_00